MPIRHLTHVLYPPACLLCHAPLSCERILCEACRQAMPRNGPSVCTRCGATRPGAFGAARECASCQQRPLAFDRATAPWQYLGPAKEAVRQFKYHQRWRLGRWLAQHMARVAARELPLEHVTAVLPIPRHWLKRRLQGCHPASELAHRVADLLQKPHHPDGLRRIRWTSTQTRLPWPRRFPNVHDAFQASRTLHRHHTVLLIDDVFTSGATAHAAALALKAVGVQRVFVLTAARAPATHAW